MRYNGVSINEVHPLVSLDHCQVEGWHRDIRKVEAAKRDLLAYARDDTSEFYAVVNICGRTPEAGEEALAAVRAWALGGGGVHEIDDGKSPGRVLDGTLLSVDEIELVHGFGRVRVTWELEQPHKRSTQETTATVATGTELAIVCEGTAEAYPVFEITPLATAAELTLTLDDAPLLRRTVSTSVGERLVLDTRTQRLTLGGKDVAAETDWTATDYDRALTPGTHVLRCSSSATMTARWFARWA